MQSLFDFSQFQQTLDRWLNAQTWAKGRNLTHFRYAAKGWIQKISNPPIPRSIEFNDLTPSRFLRLYGKWQELGSKNKQNQLERCLCLLLFRHEIDESISSRDINLKVGQTQRSALFAELEKRFAITSLNDVWKRGGSYMVLVTNSGPGDIFKLGKNMIDRYGMLPLWIGSMLTLRCLQMGEAFRRGRCVPLDPVPKS